MQHDTRINIRHGPFQTVEEAIRRCNIGQAEAKRKRIDGAAQTDWTLTMADINKHNKEDQLTLRAIMSVGMWDKHLLHKAGLALDSKCERCGNARDDIFHRFWTCTALKATYDEDASLFQDFTYNEAPACLTTCRLAIELAGDVTGPLWAGGTAREQEQPQRKRKYDD